MTLKEFWDIKNKDWTMFESCAVSEYITKMHYTFKEFPRKEWERIAEWAIYYARQDLKAEFEDLEKYFAG
jgi:hypothetical protein